VNETSSTAVKAPYVLVSDSTVIMRRLWRWGPRHRIGDDAGRAPDATLSESGSAEWCEPVVEWCASDRHAVPQRPNRTTRRVGAARVRFG
jgi:hypothetical protein